MSGTDLPRTPKAMVDQLREAVQTALSARQSRMRVMLPPGFDYGIESQRKGKQVSNKIVRSDRELARLFVEMFQGTGLVPTVCFSNVDDASAATKLWGDIEARTMALDPGAAQGSVKPAKGPNPTRAQSRGAGGGGFGTAAPSPKGKSKKPISKIPESAEVIFVVAPGPSQCEAVQSFCMAHGIDRLVVLLNARSLDEAPMSVLDDTTVQLASATGVGTAEVDQREYFDTEFVDVYAFLTDPAGKSTDPAVLFKRSAAEPWSLVSKPKIGPPRQLLSSDKRPSIAVMRAAIDEKEGEGLLGALGSAFGS
eukprot:scaffold131350_cov30-Tisochrysis_lutea.AAC.1